MAFYQPHVNTEAENLEILRHAEEERKQLGQRKKTVQFMVNSKFGREKKRT